jgi:hypothetical protein
VTKSKPLGPRLFEVEACRDGRLSGAEIRHFRSHLNVCPICASEARALEALADLLRSSAESSDTRENELHVRRERTRLLAAFDAKLVPAPRSRVKVGLLAAAAVALAALAVLVVRLSQPDMPLPAVTVAHAPPHEVPLPVVVQSDGSAKWSRRSEHDLETIVLESGELAIRVTHARSKHRLLVVLPDGELEDVGTTFSVRADAGHTTRVTVSDGSVVLRLRGKPPLALRAGEAFSQTPEPIVSAQKAASPAPLLPSRRTAPANTAAAKAEGPSQLEPDSSSEFRAAMAELKAGNNARAATLFAAFLAQHPRDSRGEDAAYLRVIALQRTRDATATKQAAAEYLRRYPEGFRKAEVEQLSR